MKKVYLAGAMQCFGKDSYKAKEWRDKVKKYFEDCCECFEIISPTDYYEYGTKRHKTEREVMRFDLRKVKEADVILVNLDNIRDSLGTSDEILYAYINGKTIIGFLSHEVDDEYTIMNLIHPWKYEQIDRIETGKHSMEQAMEYIKNNLR